MSNLEFIASEDGKNFTTPGENCGQTYNTYDFGFTFYHTTDQLFNYCGNIRNVTDNIDVDILLTPSGYSLPSMLLQTGNDANDGMFGCDISSITTNSGQTP